MFNGFVRDRTVGLYKESGETRHDYSILEITILDLIIGKKVLHRSFPPQNRLKVENIEMPYKFVKQKDGVCVGILETGNSKLGKEMTIQ